MEKIGIVLVILSRFLFTLWDKVTGDSLAQNFKGDVSPLFLIDRPCVYVNCVMAFSL